MEADWSIALGADDPVLVVPWSAENGARFVDLRGNPDLMAEVMEARSNATLRHALLELNGATSPWWTAKCDQWVSSDDPADPYEMDADAGQTACVAGSYIDLLARDMQFRQSFGGHEEWLRRVTERLRSLQARAARVDLVLRAAAIDGEPGFAVSCFVAGCGESPEAADLRWSRAFTVCVPVILESLQADSGD